MHNSDKASNALTLCFSLFPSSFSCSSPKKLPTSFTVKRLNSLTRDLELSVIVVDSYSTYHRETVTLKSDPLAGDADGEDEMEDASLTGQVISLSLIHI